MRFVTIAAATALSLASPALASGDAAKGESGFKKCKACHAITAADGTQIQKGGKTGPDLFGVIGRVVGSTDFNYGASIKAVGETGLVWDEDMLVSYLANPSAWLKEKTGDAAAKSNMSFRLTKGAEDIAEYLESVAE